MRIPPCPPQVLWKHSRVEGWRGTDRSLGSLGGLASAALGSTLSPEALWGTAVSAVSLEGASGSGPYSGRRRVHAAAVGTRTKCLLCARDGDTPSVSSVPPNAPRRPRRWGQGLNCWNYRSLLDVGVGGSERFIRVSAAPPLHTPAPGEPPEDRPCLSLPPTLHHPQRASREHCLEPSTPTFLPAVPSSRRLTCHPLGPVPSSNPTSVTCWLCAAPHPLHRGCRAHPRTWGVGSLCVPSSLDASSQPVPRDPRERPSVCAGWCCRPWTWLSSLWGNSGGSTHHRPW